LKTHAKSLAIGGLFVPIALVLATLIANEAQTLLGLDLERVSLAIYLVPFLVGAATVIAALLRFEAAKVGGELGDALGGLADVLLKGGEETPPPPAPAVGTSMPGIEPPPAPPAPPPPGRPEGKLP
jgi:hypothetical protein